MSSRKVVSPGTNASVSTMERSSAVAVARHNASSVGVDARFWFVSQPRRTSTWFRDQEGSSGTLCLPLPGSLGRCILEGCHVSTPAKAGEGLLSAPAFRELGACLCW